MKAHDSKDFKVAMIKKANDHTSRLHWALWEKRNVPAGHKILSAIWAFKRKRRIDTRAVYKHKSRINVHGGQQTYGVNYWETFPPVVNWFSIRCWAEPGYMKYMRIRTFHDNENSKRE
jgi:hypothetical protein